MKKFLTIALILMLAARLSAQGGITTFLGIPVDGSKPHFIQKMKARGFRREAKDSNLTGMFEGRPVIAQVFANKGRVYRVMITDMEATADVNEIVWKYNCLIDSLRNSSEYTEYEWNHYIRETEAPFYEDYIREGYYYAEFFQVNDPELYSRRVSFRISDELGGYRFVTCYDNIYNLPKDDD